MKTASQLTLLVVANLLFGLGTLFSAELVDVLAKINPLFNPIWYVVGGLLTTHLLLLATFTALHDPKAAVTRWAMIVVILFATTVVYAIEFSAILYWREMRWVDASDYRFWEILFMSVAPAGAIFAGCIGVVLFIHILLWPLRAAFGLRLEKLENADFESDKLRQFGIVNLLVWVGLFAALFWLIRWGVEHPEVVQGIFVPTMIIAVASLLFVPWVFILRGRTVRVWPLLLGVVLVASVTYLLQEATYRFNMAQIAKARAGVPLLPPLGIWEYGGFNFAICGTAMLNFFLLRAFGFRLRSVSAATTSRTNPNSA